ncbi:hypothetical protein [Micromonospora sp. NPDC005652]|uniref:hypothetical protein n=1 Tax=Micromonospora sp. NPDC005652 TaxID=3157046 RepID=UPI0033D0F4CB
MSEDLRLMTLAEVSALFNIPLRDLKRDTKAGRAPHVPIGRGTERVHRRMTAEHVRAYQEVRAREVAPQQPQQEQPVDPLRQAIQATKKATARRRGHRAVAR